MTTILAIETSCDETAAAVVQKDGGVFSVLANVVQSQASLHAKWGGVVPELASREHIKNIAPVIDECLLRSEKTVADIDALAVTQGPGLMPALVVGVNAAKTLASLWQKPLLGIHHIEGHIYANLLSPETRLEFPLLALVVSGGHTQLMLMEDHFTYRILGETQDDAVGEAFDKVAKMLGLPYPGGPQIAKRADAFSAIAPIEEQLTLASLFPRPMADAPNYSFSFSGLKTAVLYYIKKHESEKEQENFRTAVSFAFQEAATDVLVQKTKKALREYSPKTLVMAGGVAANVTLRKKLEESIQDFPQTNFLMPEFIYSLDNAAMIGAAAALRFETLSETEKIKLTKNAPTLEPNANLAL
jgi:N6-L-threonylcarbamoyladenine synthase